MKTDRSIIFLALAQIITWAGLYYVFPALLVRWEQDLGWSKIDITGAITLAIFVSAISSPFSGRLVDAGKGPQVMAGCIITGSLGLYSLSWISSLAPFYLAWAIIGMCFAGCLYDPCFALITRGRGKDAKKGIILVTLIAGFAGAISFPSAHYLSEAFGWRITVQVFAIVVIVLATPLAWFGARSIENNRVTVSKSSPTARRPGLRQYLSPVFLCLGTGFALAAVVHGVTLLHLLPILHDRGIHPEVAVLAASFIGPMQVAGRLAMMAAQKHASNHGVAMSCFVVMGLSILVLIASGPFPALLVFFVILFGGGYGMVSIIRPVIARDILGEQNFGANYGVLSMFYFIGWASAPFIGALVWGLGGYDLVLPCLVAVAIAGLVLYSASHKMAVN